AVQAMLFSPSAPGVPASDVVRPERLASLAIGATICTKAEGALHALVFAVVLLFLWARGRERSSRRRLTLELLVVLAPFVLARVVWHFVCGQANEYISMERSASMSAQLRDLDRWNR